MKFIDILRMIMRNLVKRKGRTLLTISGVFIGTTAIIVMISLGIGMSSAQDMMIDEWADLTLITVMNSRAQDTSSGASDEELPPLDDSVITKLKDIKGVKAVTPWYEMYSGWQIAVYSGDYVVGASLIGCDITQLSEFGYKLIEGEWQTEGDFTGVVYAGNYIGAYGTNYIDDEWEYTNVENRSQYLFDPMKDEMGVMPMTIDTSNWEVDFSVINSKNSPNQEYNIELNTKGIIQFDGKDYYTQEGIFIDMNSVKTLIEGYNEMNDEMKMEEFNGVYNNVRIRASDMDIVPEIEEYIQEELGYRTRSDGQARENMRKQTQLIQMMLGALAAISLFVAALNITNTMIMSIIERTKEIGIMKVLGCDISRIRLLFLGEAAAIGFIGGVVGIIFSYIVSALMNSFLAETLMQMMGGGNYSMPEGAKISQIPIWLALFALAFATIIGIIAGLQPANRSVKISALSAISND